MDFEADIEPCLQILHGGGLILYPTDTIWGIGCDATNESAVSKIYQLKQRSDTKSMIVLVPDEREILKYVSGPDLSLFDYLEEQERPTTVVYEGAIGLADNLVSDDGSIAIRICDEPFCKHLLRRFRKPIVSTSANISGQSTASTFSAITEEIKNGVDYIVRYRQEDQVKSLPSKLIKWEGGRIVVLRD